ncbi:ABC transporter ATP-binding protein [Nakamurella antarctica]|uniref:ABC transporter ATP-binding protein n=1 Tax=Nakamurella antarctica TaxID=1902245 RepID=A0A3G9A126_9ACTN|nr:ABC transporter ATP-binding protein [Nakamurella antarctica]
MSATLVAKNLAAGHGDRTLFSGLDLVIAPGAVIGLVGANGAGKSTLLRLFAQAASPESGSVTLAPADAIVGWLPQEVERLDGETVLEHLARRTGVAAAQAQLDSATQALAGGDSVLVPGIAGHSVEDQYSHAFDHWLAIGAADLAERTEQAMADVGLAVSQDSQMTTLSGGQAARVGLAALLLSRFDILLLDEPTNDLDLAGLARLERFVREQRSGIVVVSHDREFLARCVTTVVELDLVQQQVAVYGGGYEAYLAERALARQHARDEYEEFNDKRTGLENRAAMQRGWTDKGLRAQSAKKAPDNDKIGRASRIEGTEKQAAKISQTERLIERLTQVAEPRKEWQLQLEIAVAPRSGSVVATLNEAVVRRGDFQLGPVSLQVNSGDRIGITGPNGSGKTTLLAALLGRIEVTSGAWSLGTGVAIGEVDQARSLLTSGLNLLEAFAAQIPEWPAAEVRTLLAKFGLKSDHVLRPTAALSPGERTRSVLALLQARGVNVLVLDEPTNHLDVPAIEQLEQALDTYEGTLLLVTHDRRMLEAVTLNRRWQVSGGQVSQE